MTLTQKLSRAARVLLDREEPVANPATGDEHETPEVSARPSEPANGENGLSDEERDKLIKTARSKLPELDKQYKENHSRLRELSRS